MASATKTTPKKNTGPKATLAGESYRVSSWKVFKPGFHKGRYYSAADCKRIVDNYAKYSTGPEPYVKVKTKLGHDDEQRLANSMGMPNQGPVTSCRLTEDGGVALDIDNVPTFTGKEIEAGRINDGSVELQWDVPDPLDPRKVIPGPVLMGIAFLGEEHPGVKGLPSPKVTKFSDPPNRHSRIIRFSEVDPMNRDEMIAQLKAKGLDIGADPSLANLPDEALAALLKGMPAPASATPPNTVAPGANMAVADTNPTPATTKPNPDSMKPNKDDYSALSKKCDDMQTQFNSLSAAFNELNKDKDDAKMAVAMARDYQANIRQQKTNKATEVVDKAIHEGRAIPAARAAIISDLCLLSNEKKDCFAAGTANAGKTPFEAACEDLLKRPADRRFSANANPLGSGSGENKIDQARRAKLLSSTETGRAVLRREAAASRN